MKPPIQAFLGLALLLGAAGCSGQEEVAKAREGRDHGPLAPCRIEGSEEAFLCGKLPVWENRGTKEGRRIDLSVVVLPGLEKHSFPDAVFVLNGGPGIGNTPGAAEWAGVRVLRRRDIVLVDLRGTGASNPLHCDLTGDPADPQSFLEEMYPVGAVKACRDELSKKADLTQYTTPIAMEDLEEVRERLGYETIDLMGHSYGARASLVYMRRHPERVRSAVLVGAPAMSVKMPLDHARLAQEGMDLLLDDCAADPSCHATFPDPARELHELLARLRREPASATYPARGGEREAPVTIRAEIFAEHLRSLLYAPDTSHRVPWLIHAAHAGDFRPFLDSIVPAEIPPEPILAEGFYLSITSTEDVPFITDEEIPAAVRGTFLGDYRIVQQRRAGEIWPRGSVPQGYKGPVVSSAPVLLVAGGRDPVTPPRFAEEIARHLSDARIVTVPHMAHLPYGLEKIECLDEIAARFLDDPHAADIGEGCIPEMTPPPFLLRGEGSPASP